MISEKSYIYFVMKKCTYYHLLFELNVGLYVYEKIGGYIKFLKKFIFFCISFQMPLLREILIYDKKI